MDLKKVYYYLICLFAIFVFFWGVVDFANAALGLSASKGSSPLEQAPTLSTDGANEQSLDVYYQRKMLYDRFSDSLIRIIVSGLVFTYSRIKLNKLEA
jgi:hypothetical protein